MKVLYLTKYTRKGASSRLRSYQYFPFLERENISITVSPLFNDIYLESLYAGKTNKFAGIRGYINRFFTLFTVFSYDKLVIEKELFPYLPAIFERLLSFFNISYLVDYDDAIFHNYDRHPNTILRKLLHNKIDVVMRNSDCVIAGNSYLAERAKSAGAINVEIIPTVIDMERYMKFKKVQKKINDPLIIGWVGSPSTFKYVQELSNVLLKVVEKYKVQIHIVGAKGDLGFIKNVKYIPWSEETEVATIAAFDIGIMPLQDTPWEKGKCSYKLIQYMGCKVPVIATPVGMNKEVVKQEMNGFLAASDEVWLEAFESYICNRDLRLKHGKAGFETVIANFNVENTSKKLVSILKK